MFRLLTLFLKPKYAPTNVNGTDTPNHNPSKAKSVVKGTAAELPLLHKTKFITKNKPKTILKQDYCWYTIVISKISVPWAKHGR